MLRYPVKLSPEGGKVLVAFPDFPDVHTFGDDEPEALVRAVDALETMLMAMIEDKEAIPAPKPIRRGRSVTLPALTRGQNRSVSGDEVCSNRKGGAGAPSQLPPAANRSFARPGPCIPPRSIGTGVHSSWEAARRFG
jgi:predicted RNase H-like HicB family nuclease